MSINLVQHLVRNWVVRCFGTEQANSAKVRALRLLEEAVEFAQSVGVANHKAQELVDYVYSRPPGEPSQELGGVGITFLAATSALGYNATDIISDELDRILDKPVDHFAKRNQTKLEAGFA